MSENRALKPKDGFFFFLLALCAVLIVITVGIAGCVSSAKTFPYVPLNASTPSESTAQPLGTNSSLKIICLTSDAAELLVAIGAGEDVVGVPESLYTHHPQLVAHLPNARSVGSAKTPDIETILALHPDLIVMSAAMAPAGTDRLQAAGIPAYSFDCHEARDLPDIARTLGNLTAHPEKAEAYAVFTEKILAEIHNRLENNPPPEKARVYMESYTDYFVYGRDTGADDLLQLLHCQNIGGDQSLSSMRVSTEWVLAENPDVLIKTTTLGVNRTLESEYSRVVARKGFSSLNAVRGNRTYVVNGDVIFSPQAAIGALHLAKTLYPARFSDINTDEVSREYANQFSDDMQADPVIFPKTYETCRLSNEPQRQ